MNPKYILKSIVFMMGIVSIFIITPQAFALTFTPTEAEWLSWPVYCRARYVVSGAGQYSKFQNRVPQSVVEEQHVRVGEKAWYWLHHYCAAKAYLQRASAAESDSRAAFWLREAEVNVMGHYKRIGRDDPMFPDVAITIAEMHVQRDDDEAALKILDEAMKAHPTATSPYGFAAIICKRRGDLTRAISILLNGNEAIHGQSAEIHYFLGLLYIDIGELDAAVIHAQRAYELGYPLPGLASMLRRHGRIL